MAKAFSIAYRATGNATAPQRSLSPTSLVTRAVTGFLGRSAAFLRVLLRLLLQYSRSLPPSCAFKRLDMSSSGPSSLQRVSLSPDGVPSASPWRGRGARVWPVFVSACTLWLTGYPSHFVWDHLAWFARGETSVWEAVEGVAVATVQRY